MLRWRLLLARLVQAGVHGHAHPLAGDPRAAPQEAVDDGQPAALAVPVLDAGDQRGRARAADWRRARIGRNWRSDQGKQFRRERIIAGSSAIIRERGQNGRPYGANSSAEMRGRSMGQINSVSASPVRIHWDAARARTATRRLAGRGPRLSAQVMPRAARSTERPGAATRLL